MSTARGLTRVWIVLTVVYMLVVAAGSVMVYYDLNDEQRSIEAEIERREKNPVEPAGYYYSPPVKLLERIQWTREQMKWAVPLIAVAPPIGIYCLVAGLAWAIAGFKPDPPRNDP